MININIEKCTGCGLCSKDCTRNDIQIIRGKAYPLNKSCMGCGHCIAICPHNAVVIDNYDMKEVIEYNAETFEINPENLLNSIKFRRSVRHFKNTAVEKEKIKKIIEAGRYSPSGSNKQPLSFVVVQQKMRELTAITVDILYKYACNFEPDEHDPLFSQYKLYTDMWKQIYSQYKKGNDILFFNAPAMIIILHDKRLSAYSTIDGQLASSNMVMMANSLDLGVCYNGFFTFASEDLEIRNLLYLPDNIKVVASLLIGYADVKYLRTVPRKKPEVQWI